MPVIASEKLNSLAVLKRQFAVCAAFALLLAILLAGLYLQDRWRVWSLHKEQLRHRLDVAFELISRELDRVRADVLFLADQEAVRRFVPDNERTRKTVEVEFANLVRRKETYDQIRLLNLQGDETVRVNYVHGASASVAQAELQDKSDRYYFREALSLSPGEVFISDFDLNLEHGKIENPLKPVIRFVTPVANEQGVVTGILALNYLGANVLQELDDSTLPGFTMLLRPDGNFLRSRDQRNDWGWVLGHDRTFATRFPNEWAQRNKMFADCLLTENGAFSARSVRLGRGADEPTPTPETTERDSVVIVSHLSRDQVFAASNELLSRLLLLAGCIFVPLAVFARYWAQATLTRQVQAQELMASEGRLRQLSSRLLRIQEDERRAISREIHDELGQQVTAINLDLKLADRCLDSPQTKPHLERAIRENEELLKSMHRFATRVRPAVLDDLGLRDAIESHLWDFQERTGIEVDSNLKFDPTRIPHEVADNAYRLLQESLNNIAKHADASKAWVTISEEQDETGQYLHMTIRDNGRGYQTQSTNGRRLGLIGMQERVDLLSGNLSMESEVDQGTNIEIRLPLWNQG